MHPFFFSHHNNEFIPSPSSHPATRQPVHRATRPPLSHMPIYFALSSTIYIAVRTLYLLFLVFSPIKSYNILKSSHRIMWLDGSYRVCGSGWNMHFVYKCNRWFIFSPHARAMHYFSLLHVGDDAYYTLHTYNVPVARHWRGSKGSNPRYTQYIASITCCGATGYLETEDIPTSYNHFIKEEKNVYAPFRLFKVLNWNWICSYRRAFAPIILAWKYVAKPFISSLSTK